MLVTGVRAEEMTEHLLGMATVSNLKEFIIRGQLGALFDRYLPRTL